MRKKLISILLCISMTAAAFAGCGKKADKTEEPANPANVQEETVEEDTAATDKTDSADVKTIERPTLISDFSIDNYEEGLIPSVPAYSVDTSFSNVINASDFLGSEYVREEYKEKLANNLFVVGESDGYEFWEQYEFNAYSLTPNFVTIDSLMHTYHLYFSHLLKNIERTYLSDEVSKMCAAMFEKSLERYDEYKGSEWETAAEKNVEYYAVACMLTGNDVDVPDYAQDIVETEMSNIMDASGITESAIFENLREDYSQYKPRGYYEGDLQLEKYFRTMMWLGRINLNAADEESTRAAVLMSISLKESVLDKWEAVYAVTSFFAGASDDLGYCEYMPLIETAYGVNPGKDDLIGNAKAWNEFFDSISKLDPPKIQSIPVYTDEENVIPGFRMMGQRFTIDAYIMQNLIYRAVEMNEEGKCRMLPTVLDVPAALGSDVAKDIALSKGASDFPDYETNMKKLRNDLENGPESIWNASLYSQWLNTLRPLLAKKGEGYPSFMQNNEWTRKTIETFAGSFTELKHDTILYGKQPMAEMGGGDIDPVDDRGYVEPEPLVFARFENLAMTTKDGLKKYGMISSEDEENLNRLAELSDKLLVIAQKELKNELPTDEEFELIRNYGGNIEHFWYDSMKSEADDEYFTTEEFPSALVVDVATDPNGVILEAGTSNPQTIAVIVPVDGILRIATGSVYDFYEFEWSMSDRLTDSKWREMVGAAPGLGYLYEKDDSIVKPDWTLSYREEKWHWEW